MIVRKSFLPEARPYLKDAIAFFHYLYFLLLIICSGDLGQYLIPGCNVSSRQIKTRRSEMIVEKELLQGGAIRRNYAKGEIIFFEGSWPSRYFQVKSGRVKMTNIGECGKEVIQRIFGEGESFGEPPLIGDFPYPARAVALDDCIILELPKSRFNALLRDSSDLALTFLKLFVNRLHYKSKMLNLVSHSGAKERVKGFLEIYATTMQSKQGLCQVKLSRQQIADSVGLRVETTIRAIKALQREDKLILRNRKIFIDNGSVDQRA